MSDYWYSVLHQRLSRRRGMTAVAGAGAAAAFLAACGGGSSSEKLVASPFSTEATRAEILCLPGRPANTRNEPP